MDEAKQPRIYALDNLRGLMMWLGIVLHASLIYTVMFRGVPWHDNEITWVADILVVVIHTFRMPVFFILAGFFAALLVQSRGVDGMAKNRFQRLVVPFAVFYLPLLGLQYLFASLFLHRMVHGTWGIDTTLNTVPGIPSTTVQDPMTVFNTLHLWFIWLLIGICAFTALVYRPLSRLPIVARIGDAVAWVAGNPLGFIVLAIPTVLCGIHYQSGIVEPRQSFLPPWTEWVHYAALFGVGFAMYRHQGRLFEVLQRRWILNAIGGALFLAATVYLVMNQHPRLWYSATSSAVTWLWSLALIGASLRHMSRNSPVLGYLAASSYFVYLIHMSLTIAFGLLLFTVPLPALVKLLLVIVGTTVVSVVAYHLFVRSTAVGQLLNGKRYPKRAAVEPAFRNTVNARA